MDAIAHLRRAAGEEVPCAEGATKRMPESLRLAMQSFAGAYDR